MILLNVPILPLVVLKPIVYPSGTYKSFMSISNNPFSFVTTEIFSFSSQFVGKGVFKSTKYKLNLIVVFALASLDPLLYINTLNLHLLKRYSLALIILIGLIVCSLKIDIIVDITATTNMIIESCNI